MTLFHFGNCIALAYGPYFLTYKYSGLTEYGAFWKCVQVGIVYMVTQVCKMLLLATFFPTTDGPPDHVGLLAEFVKTTVDFGDLIGLSLAMHRISGSGHIKVLVAALGWACADLLLTRALHLWVGARGPEFDWKYIQMSLDANVSLIHWCCVCALLWLWSRSDLAASLRPLVCVLLVVCVYRPLVAPLLTIAAGNRAPAPATLLAATTTPSVCVAAITLHIFATHSALTKASYY